MVVNALEVFFPCIKNGQREENLRDEITKEVKTVSFYLCPIAAFIEAWTPV